MKDTTDNRPDMAIAGQNSAVVKPRRMSACQAYLGQLSSKHRRQFRQLCGGSTAEVRLFKQRPGSHANAPYRRVAICPGDRLVRNKPSDAKLEKGKAPILGLSDRFGGWLARHRQALGRELVERWNPRAFHASGLANWKCPNNRMHPLRRFQIKNLCDRI